MNFTKLAAAAVVVGSMSFASTDAFAVAYTDSWSLAGASGDVSTNLGLGSAGFVLNSGLLTSINTSGGTTNGTSGPAYVDGLVVAFAPVTQLIPPAGNITVTFGTFTFVGTGVIDAQTASTLAMIFTGNVTDSGAVYDAQGAQLSLTWTKAGDTAPIGFSASFQTDPERNLIPEPATLALLGAGLLGLGVARRRRS